MVTDSDEENGVVAEVVDLDNLPRATEAGLDDGAGADPDVKHYSTEDIAGIPLAFDKVSFIKSAPQYQNDAGDKEFAVVRFRFLDTGVTAEFRAGGQALVDKLRKMQTPFRGKVTRKTATGSGFKYWTLEDA